MSSYQIYSLAGDSATLGRLQAEQVRSLPHLIRAPRAPWADNQAFLELWASGIHEARILASIVAEPKRVTLDQMERWASDLDSWGLCDQCCTNLWVRTPFAREQALVWSEREEEFVVLSRSGGSVCPQHALATSH